jgi:hypothetical protein
MTHRFQAAALAVALALPLSLLAQNAALMPVPRQTFWSTTGKMLAGGYVYTCVAGTPCSSAFVGGPPLSNPLATFTDSTGLTANPNPMVLDAFGSATMFLGAGSYKIVVENSAGVVQSSLDAIPGNGQFASVNAIGTLTAGGLANLNGGASISGSAFVVNTFTPAFFSSGAKALVTFAGSDATTNVPNTSWLHTYYAPLASPSFTGTATFGGGAVFSSTASFSTYSPTVPAPVGGASDNTLSAPNTAWVQSNFPNLATAFTHTTGSNGYQVLPGGLKMIWGTAASTAVGADPILYTASTFSTATLTVVGNDSGSGANPCGFVIGSTGSVTPLTGFTATCKNSTGAITATVFHYLAIGY